MKYITKYKSPNYNSRNNSRVELIIIHYTALKNTLEAISYLCKKEKKVSSHYLISQNGNVYNLVEDKYRAWHAGQAFWHEITDINSISIGIELDYNPKGKNNKFSFKMICSLKKLIRKLQKNYKINKNGILAHSDIAPFRKKDPGKHFPWHILCSKKISFFINKKKTRDLNILKNWFYKNSIFTRKQICLFILAYVGYQISQINDEKSIKKIIKSYQSHFLQNNVSGNIDQLTLDYMLNHLLNLVLTKK